MKVKWTFVIVAIVMILSFGFAQQSQSVRAATDRPGRPLTLFNRSSQVRWDGTMYGIHSTMAIERPPLSNTADEEYQHSVNLYSDDFSQSVTFGTEACGGGTTTADCICQGNHLGGTSQIFFFMRSPNGLLCTLIPVSDPMNGRSTPWAIENNSSNNGVEYICQPAFTPTVFSACNGNYLDGSGGSSSYFPLPVWKHIIYYVSIKADVTKHLVFGNYMNTNNWRQGCIGQGCWNFMVSPVQPPPGVTCLGYNAPNVGCPDPVGNPPQMYWDPYPFGDSTGGSLFHCVYPTGTTCQLNM